MKRAKTSDIYLDTGTTGLPCRYAKSIVIGIYPVSGAEGQAHAGSVEPSLSLVTGYVPL